MRAAVLAGVCLSYIACSGGSTAPTGSTSPPPFTPTIPFAVPSIGAADAVDIATWNVEWFGDLANGPADESRQATNVRTVLAGADVDVWALQEVVSVPQFRSMLSALPGYDGIVANDALVQGGPQAYSDFGNAEQKVALVWRTSVASLVSARVVLSSADFEFAGRPPVEFRLRLAVGASVDTLTLVVVHAKAGSDVPSYQRRVAAAALLKQWVEDTWSPRAVWIIGDLNDDLDVSITVPNASPYAPFVSDTARWGAPTKVLSDAGRASTLAFPATIDHHLATRAAAQRAIAGTARAWRLDSIVPAYGTTTSDHLPVVVRYRAR